MIVGYDLACYSYGTGPCIAPTKGYVRVDDFDPSTRERVMRDLLREQLLLNPVHPRTTSIIATFHWGEAESVRIRAGLLDRNLPERAPYPYQTEAMAEFIANTWVGDDEPPGVTGRS